MKKFRKGFTLIELIVVIAVIGVLVLLAIPKFMGYTKKAQLTEFINNTSELEKASERYYIDTQDWPRLTNQPYTTDEINQFSKKIYDKTGKQVSLDPDGKYYDIDYDVLQKYIRIPDNKEHYVIQNPVGTVYALDDISDVAKNRISEIVKPKAIITMSPENNITTATDITFSYNNSTAFGDRKIVDAEWENKFTRYKVGTQTVKLRVKDSAGTWSNWTEINFNVQAINNKPTAVITMSPIANITNATTLTWNYASSTDPDGDSIINAEWQGKQDIYPSIGNYTVQLRVQDSKGLWSDWTSVNFSVLDSGPKPLQTVVPSGYIAINSRAELESIGKTTSYPASGKYILMANLDLSASEWVPIASLNGTFDGNGLEIKNLNINKPTSDYKGLFAKTSGAKIMNLTLKNVNIVGQNYIGGLVGDARAGTQFYRVKVEGVISGKYYVGGLVGSAYGYSMNTINESVFNGNLTVSSGGDYGGALAGDGSWLTVNNSYATGKIIGPNNTRPLVGKAVAGTTKTTNCYAVVDYRWLGYGSSDGLGSISCYINSFNTTSPYFEYTSLSEAKMKTKSSYVGWDFVNIWMINEGFDYPHLIWEIK